LDLSNHKDSRASGSKKNKFITPILAKSRKRGIQIAYTVQYFKQIDIRIRTVTDFICIQIGRASCRERV
jgi:hypothetical protein